MFQQYPPNNWLNCIQARLLVQVHIHHAFHVCLLKKILAATSVQQPLPSVLITLE